MAHCSASWWLTYPSKKYELVSWDYEIPNIKKKNHVPNHQPVSVFNETSWDLMGFS